MNHTRLSHYARIERKNTGWNTSKRILLDSFVSQIRTANDQAIREDKAAAKARVAKMTDRQARNYAAAKLYDRAYDEMYWEFVDRLESVDPDFKAWYHGFGGRLSQQDLLPLVEARLAQICQAESGLQGQPAMTPEAAQAVIAEHVCDQCGGQLEAVQAYAGVEYVLCKSCGVQTPGYCTPELYAHRHGLALPASFLLAQITRQPKEVES